mgnify:CR=1 FL=1
MPQRESCGFFLFLCCCAGPERGSLSPVDQGFARSLITGPLNSVKLKDLPAQRVVRSTPASRQEAKNKINQSEPFQPPAEHTVRAEVSHVLNIGSLNIDNVYQVPHFLRGGETVAAYRRTLHVGGKGLNQSVALARAGIASSHAGIIGRDGEVLKNFLEAEGVNVAHVEMRADEASGHTVIQISPEGENAILYYPGTNTCLTREFVKNAVSDLKEGDVLLLQNETNAIRDAIEIGLEMAEAVKEGGYSVFGIGEMGIGNTTTSAAILSAVTGQPAAKTVGR